MLSLYDLRDPQGCNLEAYVSSPTRKLPPPYQAWVPANYQLRAADHLKERGAAVLWLDPGLRKTSIVLKAFDDLRAAGRARKMLVIAPRKVCQLVWRQEAAKWDAFRHLTFRFLHGPKKEKLLREDADVYLINPEGVPWLAKQFALNPAAWPFDSVTFDELTKFKNSQADRSKALRGKTVGGRIIPNLLKRASRRWGMTGTPNPNGYMDLFGQFLMLDDGAALGRFVTHYRDQYFTVDFNGFDYVLQAGAEHRIHKRLEPYVFALDAEDYVKLPELVDNVIEIELEPETWAAYKAMRDDMVTELGGVTVEAANTAAAYNKLSQMAGGAVYVGEEPERRTIEIHTAKLDALSDLMDEMGDRQLLVGYEFNHERDRMKARFGNRMAFLSDAKTDRQAEEMQADWNAGRIQFLACHPASAGHGLNFQEGGAAHLCWFSPIWDLELWDQFIRRLRRSGNTAEHVIRHILVLRKSIDELKLQALADKDTSQGRLKRALATVLSGEDPKETDMVMKLQRAGAAAPAEGGAARAPAGWGKPQGDPAPAAAQTAAAAPAEGRKAPSGWGRPAGAAPTEVQEQRETIQEKLNPEVAGSSDPIQPGAGGAFSDSVAQLRAQVEGATNDSPLPEQQQAATPPSTATRTRRSPAAAQASTGITLEDVEQAVANVMSRNGSELQPADEQRLRQWAEEHTTSQIAVLCAAAKDAGSAVASLAGTGNIDIAAETYELMFGAIEKRLQQLGFADAGK